MQRVRTRLGRWLCMNNRQAKLKSDDAMNRWAYADFGKKYKKKEKRNINKKRRNLLRQDLLSIRKDSE